MTVLVGRDDADILSGGNGNDIIVHSSCTSAATLPDGSKDRIDCGPGNDEAWINISSDHDTAINCETLHTG
jgi:hypothetical protein